jgi:hypothetical protein
MDEDRSIIGRAKRRMGDGGMEAYRIEVLDVG